MKLRSIIPLALALALIAAPSFAQDTHGTSPWPVPEGGTGLAAGQSGGVLCFNSTTTALSSTPLFANGVVVGGGPGACPGSGPSQVGINGQVFLGVTAGAPQWGTVSGDATIGNTGVVTFTTVNSNTGAIGSATQCVTVTNNAKGLTTAVTAATCTPAIGSITGLGTGIITALGVNVGTAGAPVINGGALGTPSSGTLTSATGLPISTGLTGAGTGVLTALGNTLNAASGLVGFSGALGTPTSGTLTNATGLPISTGVSGLGTGVATALGVNIGSAGAFTTFSGAHGTPSSITLTNATGLPVGTGISGLGTSVATALGVAVGTTGGFMTDTSTNTVQNKTISAVNNTITLPYFSAYSTAASQATTTGVSNKIVLGTELADSNNWFDSTTNYRFTPQLAGKYSISGHISGFASGGTLTEIDVSIYKNGAVYSTSFNVSGGVSALSLAIKQDIAFNGTTDFVELFGALFGTGTLTFISGTSPIRIWFEAEYKGP